MDIATIVGLIAAATTMMVGIDSNLAPMIDLPSAIIVIGGTVALLLISFPLAEVLQAGGIGIKYSLAAPKSVSETTRRELELGVG